MSGDMTTKCRTQFRLLHWSLAPSSMTVGNRTSSPPGLELKVAFPVAFIFAENWLALELLCQAAITIVSSFVGTCFPSTKRDHTHFPAHQESLPMVRLNKKQLHTLQTSQDNIVDLIRVKWEGALYGNVIWCVGVSMWMWESVQVSIPVGILWLIFLLSQPQHATHEKKSSLLACACGNSYGAGRRMRLNSKPCESGFSHFLLISFLFIFLFFFVRKI